MKTLTGTERVQESADLGVKRIDSFLEKRGGLLDPRTRRLLEETRARLVALGGRLPS